MRDNLHRSDSALDEQFCDDLGLVLKCYGALLLVGAVVIVLTLLYVRQG